MSGQDNNSTLSRLESWIELVASRSQTLLQFNSVAIAILAFRKANNDAISGNLSGIWLIVTLPLLLNIFVFLNPHGHYRQGGEDEIPWTVRNAALRSLIFNGVLIVSAICATIAAVNTIVLSPR